MFSDRILASYAKKGWVKSGHLGVTGLTSYHTSLKNELTDAINDGELGVELGAVFGLLDGQMCRTSGDFN